MSTGIVLKRNLLFLKENQKKQKVYHSFSKENGDGVWYDTTEEYQEEMELLYTTINKLPEKCRQVFLMACLNDKTYQEIADENVIGKSPGEAIILRFKEPRKARYIRIQVNDVAYWGQYNTLLGNVAAFR